MSEPERQRGTEQNAVPERARPWVAFERDSAAELPVVHSTEVSGLPVFWTEAPGPFTAGLVFRVGHADERATHSGISHLVEHLALPAGRTERVEFNGCVSQSTTWFWGAGERASVFELLRTTAASIARLPERLETERGILLTEAAGRGDTAVSLAAALHFGASEHGLIGYPEFGLRWLGLDEASAWARARFNRGNVALWMTGEPPAELELALPEGTHWPAPEPRPLSLPELSFPCVFTQARIGGAAISMLLPRSSAANVAAAVAVERARARLRYERGLSYAVDMHWEPLTADLAAVSLYCDCREGNEREAALLLRDVLEELIADGPSVVELERECAAREQHYAHPGAVGAQPFFAATNELLGAEQVAPRDLIAEAAALTPAAAAEALATGLGTALLLTLDERWQQDARWPLYPLYSSEALSGRSYRLAAPQRRSRTAPTLTVAEEGVTFVGGGGNPITVRFDDCVVLERWPDGTRVLWGSDATRLVVEPTAWVHGDGVTERIDARVARDRVVAMNPTVERRTDALGRELRQSSALAAARELRWASAQLAFGETPIEVVGATLRDKVGLLMLTPGRLVFSFGGSPVVDLPLHAISTVQPRRGWLLWRRGLVVRTADAAYRFRAPDPGRRLDAFFDALRDALAHSGSAAVVEDPPRWYRDLF